VTRKERDEYWLGFLWGCVRLISTAKPEKPYIVEYPEKRYGFPFIDGIWDGEEAMLDEICKED